MPSTLTMPKLSPTMEFGTIAKWHKKEGDEIAAGDLLFEVATDKATVEYNALDDGILRKILVSDGSEATVNAPVAILTESKDESIEGYTPVGIAPAAEEAPKEEVTVAAEEVKVAALAPTTGGLPMPTFVPETPLEGYEFPEGGAMLHGRLLASPLARKLAKERGVDLSTVKGTGPHHRVMSRDLNLGQPMAIAAFGRKERPQILPGEYEEETPTLVKKIVGKRLQESKTFIPHFYVTQEIDASPLVAAREQLKNQGIKVSFNDFIIRASALALREHPVINSGYNSLNNTLIRFKTIDICVAVSLEGGLITPIIRYADYKNLGEINVEVRSLAARARDGKLEKHEYSGGSFTISNLGMFGSTEMIAVINPPQAAILGVGGIQDKPVVKDGQVVAGKTLSFTLSSDHRVIDGADAARFLKSLKDLLENPAILLVD